jgi:hypothetical protein
VFSIFQNYQNLIGIIMLLPSKIVTFYESGFYRLVEKTFFTKLSIIFLLRVEPGLLVSEICHAQTHDTIQI